MKSFSQIKNRLLKNPEIRKAYEDLGPEFELARMLIERREKKGLTQTDLAKKVGTKQSAIARLESGSYNPTVVFLGKVAKALDTNLSISFRSR